MVARAATKADALAELARRELARRHLLDWCTYGPPTEQGPYVPEPWHRDLARRLEAEYRATAARKAARGVQHVKVVLVDALPQKGKSELTSRRGPSWGMAALGLSFAIVSAGESLAQKHSIATREMLRGIEARNVWPHLHRDSVKGSKRSEKMSDWAIPWKDHTRRGPEYIARGRRGLLSGRTADIIVTDDLYASESDYESTASRVEVTRALRSVVFQRLMARGGTLIAMGTRWGTADEKAFILHQAELKRQQGVRVDIEHWQYPLVATGSDALGKPRGEYNYLYFDKEKEAAARHDFGHLHRAILDCDPVDPQGGLYRREHFSHRYDEHPAVAEGLCHATYLSMDPAETDGGGDWTVIKHWGLRNIDGREKALALRQWRVQLDELGVSALLLEKTREKGPSGVLAEDTSSGKVAVATLRMAGVPGIVPVKVAGQGSKRDRLRGVRLLYAQGDVLFPRPHGEATGWFYDRDDSGMDYTDRQIALRGERPDMAGEVDDESDEAAMFLRWWTSERVTHDLAPDVKAAMERIAERKGRRGAWG